MHTRTMRLINLVAVIFVTIFAFAVTDYMRTKINWGNMFIFYTLLLIIGIVLLTITEHDDDEHDNNIFTFS